MKSYKTKCYNNFIISGFIAFYIFIYRKILCFV